MFEDGHITAGTLSGLIQLLVPLPNYYPDVSTVLFVFAKANTCKFHKYF